MNTLLQILVSLCIAELIHNAIEIWGMRQKVEWLHLSLGKKPHSRWPVNIDTKLQVGLIHAAIVLLVTGGGYWVLSLINLPTESVIILGIVILLLNYVITTWKVDSFHTEIGRLIRKAKKQKE